MVEQNPTGRAGKREDGMLDALAELCRRRDRTLNWIRRFATEVPMLETLMRDLELCLTTPAPEPEGQPIVNGRTSELAAFDLSTVLEAGKQATP